MQFNSFKSFNNLSVRVKICKKTYIGTLLIKNDYLILRIDMTKDIENWRNHTENFKILTGNLLHENTEITFLNCRCISQSCKGTENIISATLDYRIDRILLGKKITKQEYKNINEYEISYNNIDDFTNSRPYSVDYKKLEYKGELNNYIIILKDYTISIDFSCDINQKDNSVSINRHTTVLFSHNKKISLIKVFENIYKFRNFLMLLLKKRITVEKQHVIFGEEKYQIFDCTDEMLSEISEDLKEQLNYRCLKIEEINNLNEIYQKFLDNYDKLYPLIELYFNVTQYEVPNLTRFVNAITMIEYCSRTFNFSSAISLTKKRNPKKNDAEYKDMVISLINNVNLIYNFTTTEIEKIAENIKNARVYYIHYKNKLTVKRLSYDEQFWYSYFIQDIILINLYKMLNLDIGRYKYISFNDFYYNTNNLL